MRLAAGAFFAFIVALTVLGTAREASAIMVTIKNTADVPVEYMLYFQAKDLTVLSYNFVWKTETLAAQSTSAVIQLPQSLEAVAVEDYGFDAAVTGPYTVAGGDRLMYFHKPTSEKGNLVKTDAYVGTSKVFFTNYFGNVGPVTFALCRGGKPMIALMNMKKGEEGFLRFDDYLYITVNNQRLKVGQPFLPIPVSAGFATRVALEHSIIYINISKDAGNNIVFTSSFVPR